MCFGTSASRSNGRYLLPHELKRKWTSATPPFASVTKIGPLSRIHESSIGIGRISTPSPHIARASDACSGSVTITTGSNAATAFAMVAQSAVARSNSSPQNPLRVMRRPFHERGLVWRPLGRHPQAVLARCAH